MDQKLWKNIEVRLEIMVDCTNGDPSYDELVAIIQSKQVWVGFNGRKTISEHFEDVEPKELYLHTLPVGKENPTERLKLGNKMREISLREED